MTSMGRARDRGPGVTGKPMRGMVVIDGVEWNLESEGSGEVIAKRAPISHRVTFCANMEPSTAMRDLDKAFAKARAEGRLPPQEKVTDLVCQSCGAKEDYRQTYSIKDAMIQFDKFSSAHAGCSRKGKNDEQKHGEIGGAL